LTFKKKKVYFLYLPNFWECKHKQKGFFMKKLSKIALSFCISSSVWAQNALEVQGSAKSDLPQVQLSGQFVKYNTPNKTRLGTYGTVKKIGNHMSLTADNEYSGECVAFVKAVTINPGSTSSWKPGSPITADTPDWTVIAKFNGQSTYKKNTTNPHVAIVYGRASGRLKVFDQNYGIDGNGNFDKKLRYRLISTNEMSQYHTVVK